MKSSSKLENFKESPKVEGPEKRLKTPSDNKNQQQEIDLVDQICADIKIIADMEDLDIQKQGIESLIISRLNTLLQLTPQSQQRVMVFNRVQFNFIRPETSIQKSIAFSYEFKIDDFEIYTILINTVIDLYKREKDVRATLNMSIVQTLLKYFDNYQFTNPSLEKNLAIYDEFARKSPNDEAMSIKELKGKGAAICVEKASTAHNMLLFLGYPSVLVFGHFSSENTEESHAYICERTKNGDFIFDPTNHTVVTYRESCFYAPAIYDISDEEYDRLTKKPNNKNGMLDMTSLRAEKVKVQHKKMHCDEQNILTETGYITRFYS